MAGVHSPLTHYELLRQIFDEIGPDCDDNITYEKLRQFCGADHTREDVVRALDVDQSGTISFDNFYTAYSNSAGVMPWSSSGAETLADESPEWQRITQRYSIREGSPLYRSAELKELVGAMERHGPQLLGEMEQVLSTFHDKLQQMQLGHARLRQQLETENDLSISWEEEAEMETKTMRKKSHEEFAVKEQRIEAELARVRQEKAHHVHTLETHIDSDQAELNLLQQTNKKLRDEQKDLTTSLVGDTSSVHMATPHIQTSFKTSRPSRLLETKHQQLRKNFVTQTETPVYDLEGGTSIQQAEMEQTNERPITWEQSTSLAGDTCTTASVSTPYNPDSFKTSCHKFETSTDSTNMLDRIIEESPSSYEHSFSSSSEQSWSSTGCESPQRNVVSLTEEFEQANSPSMAVTHQLVASPPTVVHRIVEATESSNSSVEPPFHEPRTGSQDPNEIGTQFRASINQVLLLPPHTESIDLLPSGSLHASCPNLSETNQEPSLARDSVSLHAVLVDSQSVYSYDTVDTGPVSTSRSRASSFVLPRVCLQTVRFKVVYLGSSGVGKSSLIKRLGCGAFVPSITATLGTDYTTHTVIVKNREVTLELWDTAGMERYARVTSPVLRRANAFVLVYDISNYSSFAKITNWMEIVNSNLRDASSILVLIGNKRDVSHEEREVSKSEGQKLAKELNALFLETSAKSGVRVKDAHHRLILKLLEYYDTKNSQVDDNKLAAEKNRKCFC